MLVHFLFSEIGHDACLTIGSPFDCVVDDPVKVAVNCSLIHLDYFLIETLFSGPNDFFCISATGFFNLSVPSLILSFLNFFFNFFFFSDSD